MREKSYWFSICFHWGTLISSLKRSNQDKNAYKTLENIHIETVIRYSFCLRTVMASACLFRCFLSSCGNNKAFITWKMTVIIIRVLSLFQAAESASLFHVTFYTKWVSASDRLLILEQKLLIQTVILTEIAVPFCINDSYLWQAMNFKW